VTPEERQQIEREHWKLPSGWCACGRGPCPVRRLLDEVDRQAAEARILRDETNRFGTAMLAAEEFAARLSSAIEAARIACSGQYLGNVGGALTRLWAVLGGEPAPPPPPTDCPDCYGRPPDYCPNCGTGVPVAPTPPAPAPPRPTMGVWAGYDDDPATLEGHDDHT
jgi:hypothetical protein